MAKNHAIGLRNYESKKTMRGGKKKMMRGGGMATVRGDRDWETFIVICFL